LFVVAVFVGVLLLVVLFFVTQFASSIFAAMDLELPRRTQANKRRRGTQNSESAIALEEVARLALATSAAVKLIKSCCINTFLLPSDNKYVLACKVAGQQFNENRQKQNAGTVSLLAYAVVGHALVKQLATDADVPTACKQQAEAVMKDVDSYEDMYEIFRTCKMTKCHSGSSSRIEFSVVPEHLTAGKGPCKSF
jgi:hypothetical protein